MEVGSVTTLDYLINEHAHLVLVLSTKQARLLDSREYSHLSNKREVTDFEKFHLPRLLIS